VRSVEASGAALDTILRVGLAGCFVGHGAFGFITKAAWVPYFAVGGVGEPLAWRLMPWVGAMDIAVGLLALAWPCRAVLLWAVAWAVWTALLRPLSGESCWEFWERAGNYGVPLALLVMTGWRGAVFTRLAPDGTQLSAKVRLRLAWTLRLVTFTLLAGHAGCTLLNPHGSFLRNFTAIWPQGPAGVVPAVGFVDLALALGVLAGPSAPLLVGVCLWKVATEMTFLAAGAPVWEVIERFGSYAAPLALAYQLSKSRPALARRPNHLPAT